MKRLINLFFACLFIPWAICCASLGDARADKIRAPAWAGSFYPADGTELGQTIKRLTKKAKKTSVDIPQHKRLRALVMPHAGYIYSGLTASHASHVLHEYQFNKIILVGPDHRVGLRNCAVSNVSAYKTPLGLVGLHGDAAALRRQSDLFRSVPESDRKEHSLEVILPFLQYYIGSFELVPVVAGRCRTDRIAASINSLIDDNTLLVASSDLSHYLPYAQAVKKDKQTIHTILNLDHNTLEKKADAACGAIPVAIVLRLARSYNWEPVLLHYSNSGDTAGDRGRVVGYAAIAFFGDLIMKKKQASPKHLTKKQGQALIQLARHTIMERLGQKAGKTASATLAASLKDSDFKKHCGTFVTLNIDDQLRGCIGNLTATESLLSGVKRNAVNAAFHDPRFSPLSPEELKHVDIEISILTEPQPLEYKNSADLVAKLRPDVDGVILRKGSARATFLPQVWEQLPGPEEFLSHLCLKAGLPADAWQNADLEVLTYQVQYFEEE